MVSRKAHDASQPLYIHFPSAHGLSPIRDNLAVDCCLLERTSHLVRHRTSKSSALRADGSYAMCIQPFGAREIPCHHSSYPRNTHLLVRAAPSEPDNRKIPRFASSHAKTLPPQSLALVHMGRYLLIIRV